MPVLDLTHSSDDGPHGAGAQQPAQNMPPQALQTLENAVLDCPTDTLVDTVLRLVRSNANVQRAFYAELVGVKRNRAPVAKWHTCARCGDEYDATDEDQECKYHDGRLKVDYAAWPDHDEDCHGPIDSKANRREYPDGFRWSCCNETTNAEGCCDGEHVPKQQKRHRVR